MIAAVESIIQKIHFACGYSGLPIQLEMKEYEKWVSRID
jgi:hypothetical protein